MQYAQKITLFLLTVVFGGSAAFSQTQISSVEAEKLLLEKADPIYPEFAKMMKLQGKVKVKITVSNSGQVVFSKLVSGNAIFKTAALDASQKRKYKPYTVGNKAASFTTIVEFFFSLGMPEDEYERDKKISQQYFKEEEKCRSLIKAQNWNQAETYCKAAILLANQFTNGRELEKSGAYQNFGYVLVNQNRHEEALGNFLKAADVVRNTLNEKNAELADLHRDIGITHHLMGNLDKARESYKLAEKIYQNAYKAMDSTDDEAKAVKQRYMKSLKALLEYHLVAAERSGATAEAEEVRRLMKNLP